MNALKQAIRWAKGQAPKNNPVKRRNTRIIVSSFTEDSRLPTYGSFIWGVIKNTVHTSHTDPRYHITLHIKTAEMIAKGTVRPVHIYSKGDKGEEYESFKIFDERPEKVTDAEPGEQIE